MTPTATQHVLAKPQDWKAAMRRQLQNRNISRYAFVRECSREGICSIHTGECLLADSETVTGQRMPSLEVAIRMAALAGMTLTLVAEQEG